MTNRIIRLILTACLLTALCLTGFAEPRYPASSGETTDAAGVISHTTLEDLRTLDRRMDKEDTLRLKIATVDFLDASDVNSYAEALFDRWALDSDDILLLMAVGEDLYAVEAGKDADKLVPPAMMSKLLAAHFEQPFLQQEYDAAIAAFIPALVTEINKADRVSVSTDGLFGRSGANMFADWAVKLQEGAQTLETAAESIFTREDRSTGFSFIKVILTVILLMVIFGNGRRKRSLFLRILSGITLYKIWKRR